MMKLEPDKDTITLLGVILLLYTAVRILFLFFSFYFISNHEELYNGTLANDMIGNPAAFLRHPNLIFCYQYMPFAGGTLVTSILALPFILVLGNSVFALKVLSIIISAAILSAMFFFLLKYFSLKAAALFGFLFALAPPYPVIISLILWGNHRESSLLSVLLFLTMFKYWFDSGGNGKRYLIMSGLIAGFGIYFDYIFIVTILTVLVFQLILKKDFFLGNDFMTFSLSSLAGLLPFFYSSVVFNFRNITVHDEGYMDKLPAKAMVKKFGALVFVDIPESFWIDTFNINRINVLSYLYYAFFILSFLFFLRLGLKAILKGKKPPMEFIFVIYIAVFALVYTFSKFYTGKPIFDLNLNEHPFKIYRDRFFTTLPPFIFALMALYLARIKNKKLCISTAIALLIIPVSSYSRYFSGSLLGEPFFYKGYAYESLPGKLAAVYDYKTCISLIENLPPEYHPELYRAFGYSIALKETGVNAETLQRTITEQAGKDYIYEGIGRGIMEKHKKLEEAIKIAETFGSDSSRHVIEGEIEVAPFYEGIETITRAIESFPDNSAGNIFYRAAGRGIYEFLDSSFINELKNKMKDNPQALSLILKGVGEKIDGRLNERSRNFLGKDRVPAIFHKDYDISYSGIVSTKLLLRNINNELLPFVMEGISEKFLTDAQS
ncbi:MAG: hypothetical protein HZA77_14235 [Candidatus Schekmanbacteria bacterium]|nr:hypothetical protein [Candidatus Schekmanbacteria bacterium]